MRKPKYEAVLDVGVGECGYGGGRGNDDAPELRRSYTWPFELAKFAKDSAVC